MAKKSEFANGPRGKVYKMKSPTACQKDSIPYEEPPPGAKGHKVIVLSTPAREYPYRVKLATVCCDFLSQNIA